MSDRGVVVSRWKHRYPSRMKDPGKWAFLCTGYITCSLNWLRFLEQEINGYVKKWFKDCICACCR